MGKIIIILFLVMGAAASQASDHIDGVPSLELHEQVDLTDLYAFKTPTKKNSLTLILNMYPGVADNGHFSSKVHYSIFLKKADLALAPSLQTFTTDEGSTVRIDCSFTDPSHHSANNKLGKGGSVHCSAIKEGISIGKIAAGVGSTKTSFDESFKIYTGPRSDAFFITREHFGTVTSRQGFEASPDRSGDNLMERINVLSIALEINLDKILPNGDRKYLSVSAESYIKANGQRKVLDRVGRPEITNLSLHDVTGGSSPLKRAYNQTSQEEVRSSAYFNSFKNRLKSNISAYDKLDDETNWDNGSLDTFAELLMDDYLVLDLSDDCMNVKNGYLEIEKSILLGKVSRNCGGRKIQDDLMGTLYALYIGGLYAELYDYRTGVSVPYQSSIKTLSDEFPYLVEPESTGVFTVNIKRALLNTYIKAQQE